MGDVKQAAERLRRWQQDCFACNMAQVQADRTTLADAWLQEHLADDDEAITPLNIAELVPADCEWVKRPSGTVAAYWDVGPQLYSLTAYFGGEVLFTARIPHGPRVDWSCKMTRGQLCKLLAALGTT